MVASLLKLCPTYTNEPAGLIFKSTRQNNQTGYVSVRQAFNKALKVAEINNFRWHDLRHTAASYLAMNGATQGELMAILGHRSSRMTNRYAHYSQKHLADLLHRTNSEVLKDDE